MTTKASLILLGAILFGLASAQLSPTTSTLFGERRTHQSGELIFDEEFDTLDFRMWQHEITMSGGGNWEFQVYWNNRTNSFVRDSTLFIQPNLVSERYGEPFISSGHMDLWGGSPADECTANSFYGCSRDGAGANYLNSVASARLRTVESFGFTYGKIEIRAKIPAGDWLWPALWMLPTHQEYGSWPTSGEVDIMESRGNLHLTENGVNIGAEQFSTTLHYGVDYTMNGYAHAHFDQNTPAGAPYSDNFHRFQLEWTPDYFRHSIDDQEIGMTVIPAGGFWELGRFDEEHPGMTNPWASASKAAPFDKDFHFVLNVAAGGTNGYFPDGASNAPNAAKPWSNTSPTTFMEFWNARNAWHNTWNGEDAAMQIDYVKVWAI